MMNDKKALEIFEACINEMYENSIPSTTWKQILKDRPKDFYSKHELSEDKYNEIKAKHEKKLPLYYRRKLAWFLLDYSPRLKEKIT